MSCSESVVRQVFAALACAPGWAVLKGWRDLPSLSGDLDLIVDPDSAADIRQRVRATIASCDSERAVVECDHIPRVPRLLAHLPHQGFRDRVFEVDFAEGVPVRGYNAITYERLTPFLEFDDRGFFRTTDAAEQALQFLFKDVRWTYVRPGRPLGEDVLQVLAALVGARTAGLLALARGGRRGAACAATVSLVSRSLGDPRVLVERVAFRRPAAPSRRCAFDPRRGASARLVKSRADFIDRSRATGHRVEAPEKQHLVEEWAGSRGGYILLAGPDGIGKTTIADLIADDLARRRDVRRVHHRSEVLPRRTRYGGGPVVDPHGPTPYPSLLSVLKILYLFVDVQLDWLLRTRTHLRRGGYVVAERGWWDLAADPRRYRLSGAETLVRLLGRFVRAPDVIALLEAPADVVLRRKAELTPAEIERQMAAWRRLAPIRSQRIHLDATKSPERLAIELIRAAALASNRRALGRWIALPSRKRARWLIPVKTRRASQGALLVYRPLTRKARFGWGSLRAAAGIGLLRCLPRATPSAGILERLQEHVPTGGTVALSRSRHSGRHTVLIADRHGSPIAVAKVATAAAGVVALERERNAIANWATSLPEPLTSPSLLAAAEGLLLVEFVPPTTRHSGLPDDVAFAAGRMSADRRSESGWFAHGDFAPWNVFRHAGGWCLVDWEEATDAATPFFDLLHYLVQSATLLGRPHPRDLLAALGGEGAGASCVSAYAEGAGLDVSILRDEFKRYVEATLPRLDPAFPDDRRAIAGRRALLAILG